MKKRETWVQSVGRYTSLGLMLPLCVVIGYAIGYYLDRWLGTNFLYLVFLLFGIAAGLTQIVREFNKDTTGNTGKS